MKSPILGSFWLVGLLMITAGVVLFLVIIRAIECFFERVAIRKLVREGRCITWKEAAGRCHANEGFLVIERRRMPRKVWFVPGGDDQVLSPVILIKLHRGLIVEDPPQLDNDLIKSEEFGQRIVEINFGGVLYRTDK